MTEKQWVTKVENFAALVGVPESWVVQAIFPEGHKVDTFSSKVLPMFCYRLDGEFPIQAWMNEDKTWTFNVTEHVSIEAETFKEGLDYLKTLLADFYWLSSRYLSLI